MLYEQNRNQCRPHSAIISRSTNMLHTSWTRFSEDFGHTARLSAVPLTCYIHPQCGSLKMSVTQRDYQPFHKHVTYTLNEVLWRCRPHSGIISRSTNMLHTSWNRFSENVGHTARLSAVPQTCYIHPESGSLKMSATQRDYQPFHKHVTYILNAVLWRFRQHSAIISRSTNMLHTSWTRLSEDVGYKARLAAIPQTCYIHPECGSLKMSATQRDYQPFHKYVTYTCISWMRFSADAQFRVRGEAPP